MNDFEQKKIFSENLIRLLESRQTTQREVANRIGVSPQTFNTWCKGVAIPRMGKIQKLADYFHVDKSALIDPPAGSASPSPVLSASETQLIDNFRQLNDEGQDIIQTTAAGLVASGRYIKSDTSGVVDEEEVS